MGMFDSIQCQYPLPDPAFQNAEFQTQDLDNVLGRYTITREGRLVRHRYPIDLQDGGNEPSAGAGLSSGEEIAYHGDIHLHATGADDEVVTFCVRLTHGRVEWIRPGSGTASQALAPFSIADLAAFLDHLDAERARNEAMLLGQLETLDPEIAAEVVRVFDDRDKAATWLASPIWALGGNSPLRALAAGNRQEVLEVLGRIEHGTYS